MGYILHNIPTYMEYILHNIPTYMGYILLTYMHVIYIIYMASIRLPYCMHKWGNVAHNGRGWGGGEYIRIRGKYVRKYIKKQENRLQALVESNKIMIAITPFRLSWHIRNFVCCQINRKSVITILIFFKLIKFRVHFCVCSCSFILSKNAEKNVKHFSKTLGIIDT